MKVVIFGSTGTIGLCAMEFAVKKGYQVRAFVRNPAKIPKHLKDKVEIFKGNVFDPSSVSGAVEGMDAVIIALGTGDSLAPTTDLSEGTKCIVNAMRLAHVKIVSACVSYYLLYEEEKVPQMFAAITVDHRRMYSVLKDSGLNWIAVFPPHLTDDPRREVTLEVKPNYKVTPGRRFISKYDVGAFLVDSLTQEEYYKGVVGLCNVPKA